MPSSLGWLRSRCRCGAARRHRVFSRRHDHRHACSHRIDRPIATDPEQVAALLTAECPGATASPIAPRSVSTTRRMPSRAAQDPQPCGVGATDRAPPRATNPNRVSLPHRRRIEFVPGQASLASGLPRSRRRGASVRAEQPIHELCCLFNHETAAVAAPDRFCEDVGQTAQVASECAAARDGIEH
jgi:hypothetical protein